jgi:hypothetical protein
MNSRRLLARGLSDVCNPVDSEPRPRAALCAVKQRRRFVKNTAAIFNAAWTEFLMMGVVKN